MPAGNLKKSEKKAALNDNIFTNDSLTEKFPKARWNFNPRNENSEVENLLYVDDRKLASESLQSLKAQFKMQTKRGIIPEYEGKQLNDSLDKIFKEISEEKFNFSNKDLYDNIEKRIAELAPESVKWFNISRSRASQVAGDQKLLARSMYEALDESLRQLQENLIQKAEDTVKTIFPGNSNSQLTQPISFGHYLMSYVYSFGRDRKRIANAKEIMNESPFVSGCMSGNSFNINREMVSRLLGFDKSSANSIDAIASRDFAIEFLSVLSNTMVTASRFAQDLISWASSQNNFISFSDSLVEQSNLLPYKRDPKALETIRANAAKVHGELATTLGILKALPMEYSQDLELVIESIDNAFEKTNTSITSLAVIASDFAINRKIMKEAATKNFSTAVDLSDWLMQNASMDRPAADKKTREIIEYAIEKGKKLSLLELGELKKLEPKITEDVYSVLIPSRALITRRSGNGSNPVQIRKAIRAARRNYLKA